MLTESVHQLNELILAGRMLEAMERFYADDVTMQENRDPPRVGKSACLEHERKNIVGVRQMKAQLLNQTVNEATGIVFSEWRFTYTDLSDNRFSLAEVSVQHWQNERIERERFYYDKPLPTP